MIAFPLFYVRAQTPLAYLYRFYIDPAMSRESPIRLEGAEAHHAIHVVRVRPGDEVTCFDGIGTEIKGRIGNVERSSLHIEPEQVTHVPEPTIRLTVAQAWLHREKAVEELVKRRTELGVTRFSFFRGDHSERPPKLSDKWTRWAVESCKQCGRSWLPAFTVLEDLAVARGARPVSLGDATFRSEVAAALLTALVLYEMGGIGPR